MTPSKRGLTVLAILLLLTPLAFATHTATITSNYAPIYETNSRNLTLTVDNDLFSTSSINNVNFLTPGFSVNNIVNLLGWTLTNNNSINFFTSTNAISNWGTQRFGFTIKANNVNQDTTNNWDITTTDSNGDQQTNSLQLQVLNDNTPPVITNTTPSAYILGVNNELFSVNANDPETGIANSNLHLSDCSLVYDNVTNTSSRVYTTTALTCSNNVCSINNDLTSFNEGNICYYYDISNNGGNTATTNNLTSIIDRTPPSVNLISPLNNVFLNTTNAILSFNAADNYDANPSCTITVNNNPYSYTANSVNNTYNLPVNDGTYNWNVACTDEVGLTGTSSTGTFNVDNQGPNISISVPQVNDRGNDVIINTSVTDSGSGVATTTAQLIDSLGNSSTVSINNNQIIIPTSTSTPVGIYTLIIDASDNVGHQSTNSVQFRVRETYAITFSIPSNSDPSSVNNTKYVNLTGNIVEDNGQIPLGNIIINGILTNQTIQIDNSTGNFNAQIQIPQINGAYTVTVSFLNGLDIFSKSSVINVGAYCGDGNVDAGEQCDSSSSVQCSVYGFSQGATSCTASCTIDTSQCSNPPPQNNGGSGGSSGNTNSQSSGNIFVPVPQVQQNSSSGGSSGIIEPPQLTTFSQGDLVPSQNISIPSSDFGIATGWATLRSFGNSPSSKWLLALPLILALLYVFGWREKEDEWDTYFRKYGQN